MGCSQSLQLCLPFESLSYKANYAHTQKHLSAHNIKNCAIQIAFSAKFLLLFASVCAKTAQTAKKHRYQRAQFILRESLPVCFKGLCGEWQCSDEWCLCARSWRRERRGSRRAYLTDECPACAARVRDSPCSVSLKAGGHRGRTQ